MLCVHFSNGSDKMMTKKEMRKVLPLLKILHSLSAEERTHILRFLTHEACEGVYECVSNGLTNPTLREEDQRELHQALAPQKNKFRRLIKQSDPEKKKRALLQVGAGAGLILEKVFPILEEYISK